MEVGVFDDQVVGTLSWGAVVGCIERVDESGEEMGLLAEFIESLGSYGGANVVVVVPCLRVCMAFFRTSS